MSGIYQDASVTELVPTVLLPQLGTHDDNPEDIIEHLDTTAVKDYPELRASVAELRAALESVLPVQSATIQFATTSYPIERLWVWADDSSQMRLTSVRWNVKFPVSITLDQASVHRLVKSLRTMSGTLGRHADQRRLLVDGVAMPWAKEAPPEPPGSYRGDDLICNLDHEALRSLNPAESLTLTWDYPERSLRLLTDSEKPARHLAASNKLPTRDFESQFTASDLRLLVGLGNGAAKVYCDSSDGSGRLRLTSNVIAYENPQVWADTVVTGRACPHPPRYIALPDVYQLKGLRDSDEPKSTPSAEPAKSRPDHQSRDHG